MPGGTATASTRPELSLMRTAAIELLGAALVAAGVVVLRDATAPADWMTGQSAAGFLGKALAAGALCGVGLAIAIRAIAVRFARRRDSLPPRERRGEQTPLPRATIRKAAVARALDVVDLEVVADDFLRVGRWRRLAVGFVARAFGLAALTIVAAFIVQDVRRPEVSARVVAVRALVLDGCACVDRTCAERASERVQQLSFSGMPAPGAPFADRKSVARSVAAATMDARELWHLVDASVRLDACNARLLADRPYQLLPRQCAAAPTTARVVPATAPPVTDAALPGPVVWRVPDGRGGAIDLCRDEQCVRWLDAKAGGRLVLADVDGDGTADVVRGDPSSVAVDHGVDQRGTITIYRAVNGTFVAGPSLWGRRGGEHLGSRVASLGDLDCDGREEVATIASGDVCAGGASGTACKRVSGYLAVIYGRAQGAPEQRVLIDRRDDWYDAALVTGDVDGDGNVDVAVQAPGGPLQILRGGAGTLEASPTWTYRITAHAFALVDDDRDSDADLWLVDGSHAPVAMARWRGGPGGLDASSARVFAQPAAAGTELLVGSFADPARTEVALSGARTGSLVIPSIGSFRLGRRSVPDPEARVTAVDLDADGLDELVYVTAQGAHRGVVVFDPRRVAFVSRWPR